MIGTQKLFVYSVLPRSISFSIAGEGEVYKIEEKELERVCINMGNAYLLALKFVAAYEV